MTSAVAAFTTCPAPWGTLHVAATANGIVAVDLDNETPVFVDALAWRLHGTVFPSEDGEVPRAAPSSQTRRAKADGVSVTLFHRKNALIWPDASDSPDWFSHGAR